MKRKMTARVRGKAGPDRPDSRRIDLARFKSDLDPAVLAALGIRLSDRLHLPGLFGSLETLTPTRTLGRGRTNLTLIEPTIVQVDAAVPHAGFDLEASPRRRPVVQMHFEAAPYGMSSPATYLMLFMVDVVGQATFAIDGSHGPGGITNAGTRVLSGRTVVTLVFENVPPDAHILGFIEQRSGTRWNWFSTQVSFPPLVISSD